MPSIPEQPEPSTPEEQQAALRLINAGLQILELACDDIKETVYNNGLYGNEFDVLALLVTIYCRRAQRLGTDPQADLAFYWPPPPDAPPWRGELPPP